MRFEKFSPNGVVNSLTEYERWCYFGIMHIWLKNKDRKESLQAVKSAAVQILWQLPLMFGGFILLFSLLMQLLGEPGAEVAVNMVKEAALPVAVVQAHMLAAVLAVGAVCYLLGRDQIKVLLHYLGTLIGPKILHSKLLRLAIWGHGFTLVCRPNATTLRSIRLTLPVSTAPRHIFGLSPQLE